LSRLFIWIGN